MLFLLAGNTSDNYCTITCASISYSTLLAHIQALEAVYLLGAIMKWYGNSCTKSAEKMYPYAIFLLLEPAAQNNYSNII